MKKTSIAPQINKSASKGLNKVKHTQTILIGDTPVKLSDIQKDPGRVMVQIMKQATSQYAKEIDNWIAAKQAAYNVEKPRRKKLIELYTSILEDLFVYRQMEQRCLRITNKAFKVVDFKTREVNQEKTDLLKRSWFKKLIKWAIESRFYGYSLIYVKDINQDGSIKEVDLVYREHVVPEQSLILKDPNADKGANYTQPPYDKWTIGVGDTQDFGVLNKVAPMYILKKHSWAAWDQFEEIFGLPIRWAKTDKSDPKTLSEIESWLDSMGKAAYGIFPRDMDFEISESTRSDAYQVFDKKRQACNEEIAIGINGQTMTTLNGSSRSQGEVHERTQDEITIDDLDFIASWINDSLMSWLKNFGYDFNDNDVFEWDLPEDLMAKLKIFQGVKNMGFELDQEQVEKTFGVKISGRTTTETHTEEDPEPKK